MCVLSRVNGLSEGSQRADLLQLKMAKAEPLSVVVTVKSKARASNQCVCVNQLLKTRKTEWVEE